MNILLLELFENILSFTNFNKRLELKTICKYWNNILSILPKKDYISNLIYETYNNIKIGESIVLEFNGKNYPHLFLNYPMTNININLRFHNLSHINWSPNYHYNNMVYKHSDIIGKKICEICDTDSLLGMKISPKFTDSKIIIITQMTKDKYIYRDIGTKHFYIDIASV